ncbi:MAG: response regulator [Alphaproteobacteria bacterium]|nr:response regulator [Alphaproteobacteria bacterium]
MLKEPKTGKAHRPLKILVVEDNDFLRQIFDTTLKPEHRISAAANATEGWRLYREDDPDLVFLDISLPDGNGHDLARRIKEESPETYVVMATASADADDKEEASFNHVDGYLTKPFGKKSIDAIIDRYWVRKRN